MRLSLKYILKMATEAILKMYFKLSLMNGRPVDLKLGKKYRG